MNSDTTYVSFAKGDRYHRLLDSLRARAKSVGVLLLATYVDGYAGGDTWKRIVNQKPSFLEIQRKTIRGPICWIDADAVLCADPNLAVVCEGFDVGLVRHSPSQINGALIWLADTGRAADFVSEWAGAIRQRPKALDQELLQAAVNAVPGLKVRWLPHEYSWVPPGGVSIVQGQASRALSEAEKK